MVGVIENEGAGNAKRVEQRLANIIARPTGVRMINKVLYGIGPPGVIVIDLGQIALARVEHRAGNICRFFQGDPVLAAGAEEDQAADDEGADDQQARDGDIGQPGRVAREPAPPGSPQRILTKSLRRHGHRPEKRPRSPQPSTFPRLIIGIKPASAHDRPGPPSPTPDWA